MRVLVHDYSGHPFQVQLSRELARRGHDVTHWHCSSYATGKGALQRSADDPASFTVGAIAMRAPFQRYSPARRVLQELEYGRTLGRRMRRARPDAVVFCNTPLIAHAVAAATLRRAGVPMVFWQQDVYSAAIAQAAAMRLGGAGRALGVAADRVERLVARQSAHVVPIAEDFMPALRRWGVADRATVVGNWAPLAELPIRRRDNAWARVHGLARRPVVLYAGTLGLKHDPSVFVALAEALRSGLPAARVVVVSEGRGRQWLEAQTRSRRLDNLVLLDYQPYDALPDVLGSADVLLALLEADAGQYSVPSKVLTYLCAKRPIVAVLPPQNAAAATLRDSRGARVLAPGDVRAVITTVLDLLGNPRLRRTLGEAARRYAESQFDVGARADDFESILRRVSGTSRVRDVRGAAA